MQTQTLRFRQKFNYQMTLVLVTVNYPWYGLQSKVFPRPNYTGHVICISVYFFCLFFFYEETELILKWNIQHTLLYKRATIEQLYQINVQNTSLKQNLQILLIKRNICRWKTVHRKSVTSSLRVSHQFTLAKPLQSSECKQICSVFQHFCISAWFTPLLQLQTKINPSKSWAFQSRAKTTNWIQPSQPLSPYIAFSEQ